jgi:acetyltransferase EpsM
MAKSIIIIGYGGHAAEVAAAAIAMSAISGVRVEGFVDNEPSGKPDTLFGLPLLGDESVLAGREDDVQLHIAIGDNGVRREIAGKFPGFEFATIIHPAAVMGQWVEIGNGTLLAPGAILTARLNVGDHVIINTGAIVSHDCQISDYANISPGCILAGNVHIGKGAFLGSGVNAAPGVKIGDDSYVGIGSVVTKDIPSGVVAAGAPARVVKKA